MEGHALRPDYGTSLGREKVRNKNVDGALSKGSFHTYKTVIISCSGKRDLGNAALKSVSLR